MQHTATTKTEILDILETVGLIEILLGRLTAWEPHGTEDGSEGCYSRLMLCVCSTVDVIQILQSNGFQNRFVCHLANFHLSLSIWVTVTYIRYLIIHIPANQDFLAEKN